MAGSSLLLWTSLLLEQSHIPGGLFNLSSAKDFNMSLVQYIILRKDLQTKLAWPLGALIAQACHATTAVMHLYKDEENTQAYLASLDTMHKVVLQAPDEKSLDTLASTLTANNIDFKLWIEEPEHIPTCIAVRPYPRDVVKPLVKKFQLFS